MPSVAGIVLDLDNTLLPTELIPERVIEPVVEAIVREHGEADAAWRDALVRGLYTRGLDEVASDIGLTEAERDTGRDAFAILTVPEDIELVLFEDSRGALEDLQVLRRRGVHAMLLTRGFSRFQRGKIDRLGLTASSTRSGSTRWRIQAPRASTRSLQTRSTGGPAIQPGWS
jgi:FMN phosphatase YigB (HAD superfamily)